MTVQLESVRLILRPFVEEDRAPALSLLADPAFMAWSSQGPLGGPAAEARFESLVENAQATGFGKMAVLTKPAGLLIGYCGIELAVFDGKTERELGFRIAAAHRRRGYAGEAARLVIADFFARSGAAYLIAYVEPGNAPSMGLIEDLGFAYERDAGHDGKTYRLYRLLRAAAQNPGTVSPSGKLIS